MLQYIQRYTSYIGSVLTFFIFGFLIDGAVIIAQDEELEPSEIAVGERLFLETRFAQFFKVALEWDNDINTVLHVGDPVMDETVTITDPLPGPFIGQSINCRACHLVDEHLHTSGGGMRSYSDFARRSPVPEREDGKRIAVRNAPPLVNASLEIPERLLLHFDAEFNRMVELVEGTLTGRNYGWLPGERDAAVAHIAQVIREDDGTGDLALEFGGLSYTDVLEGNVAPDSEFLLPDVFRIRDVRHASDRELMQAVARLIAAYTEDLVFSQDEAGTFNLSPYDVFLAQNDLPKQPEDGESSLAYSRRLVKLIKAREQGKQLIFVSANPNTSDGAFEFHQQPFRFGEAELAGLKLFFREPAEMQLPPDNASSSGNCIACHPAPNFTDFGFHNTGTTQDEYDLVHGQGAFAQLEIPELRERNMHPEAFLPATEQHPQAAEPFRAVPVAAEPMRTDLGIWNIFANPDFPSPQFKVWQLLCEDEVGYPLEAGQLLGLIPCQPDRLLPKTIALFKTPGLRDLSHSTPYMHTGQFNTLEDVLRFYRRASDLARDGHLRNGDRELSGIALQKRDMARLVRFLQALNEDYN